MTNTQVPIRAQTTNREQNLPIRTSTRLAQPGRGQESISGTTITHSNFFVALAYHEIMSKALEIGDDCGNMHLEIVNSTGDLEIARVNLLDKFHYE